MYKYVHYLFLSDASKSSWFCPFNRLCIILFPHCCISQSVSNKTELNPNWLSPSKHNLTSFQLKWKATAEKINCPSFFLFWNVTFMKLIILHPLSPQVYCDPWVTVSHYVTQISMTLVFRKHVQKLASAALLWLFFPMAARLQWQIHALVTLGRLKYPLVAARQSKKIQEPPIQKVYVVTALSVYPFLFILWRFTS